MQNPWLALPKKPPFVLDSDRYIIDTSNRLHDDHIKTAVRPDPFIGDPNAPVVLVYVNPGFDDGPRGDVWWHANSKPLAKHYAANYRHETDFFWLDDDMRATPGAVWYRDKFSSVILDVGVDNVRSKLFMVEYFPYHSVDSSNLPIVPSQEYTHHLVHAATQRGALIILMRAANALKKLIPELRDYKNVALGRSRNAALTRGNVDGYEKIIAALS